jgi:RsiW-degrading membrane proteinase PrsW (M82 family)
MNVVKVILLAPFVFIAYLLGLIWRAFTTSIELIIVVSIIVFVVGVVATFFGWV